MEPFEQEKRLEEALCKVLEHHGREYNMTAAQVLGVLRIIEQEVLDQNCQCDDCNED